MHEFNFFMSIAKCWMTIKPQNLVFLAIISNISNRWRTMTLNTAYQLRSTWDPKSCVSLWLKKMWSDDDQWVYNWSDNYRVAISSWRALLGFNEEKQTVQSKT